MTLLQNILITDINEYLEETSSNRSLTLLNHGLPLFPNMATPAVLGITTLTREGRRKRLFDCIDETLRVCNESPFISCVNGHGFSTSEGTNEGGMEQLERRKTL
jgi:hypothetical protein